jgi:hypothetical protein
VSGANAVCGGPKKIKRAVCGAINRCTNHASPKYADYGGRGITVHAAWVADRGAFFAYIAALPGAGEPGLSLDRIDNDQGYEPGNLRWTTASEQRRNARRGPRPNRRRKMLEKAPVGSRFGRLSVVSHEHRPYTTPGGYTRMVAYAVVRCDCGIECARRIADLASGHSTRCEQCARRRSA